MTLAFGLYRWSYQTLPEESKARWSWLRTARCLGWIREHQICERFKKDEIIIMIISWRKNMANGSFPAIQSAIQLFHQILDCKRVPPEGASDRARSSFREQSRTTADLASDHCGVRQHGPLQRHGWNDRMVPWKHREHHGKPTDYIYICI